MLNYYYTSGIEVLITPHYSASLLSILPRKRVLGHLLCSRNRINKHFFSVNRCLFLRGHPIRSAVLHERSIVSQVHFLLDLQNSCGCT